MTAKPILIVEDEVDIRNNMVLLLEDEGYQVFAAANGQEALALLRNVTIPIPGLVVLDFFMPVMDARGFLDVFEAERVRGHERFTNPSVLLVTAADALSRAGLEGKTVGVLKKPIDIDAFFSMVEKYCGKSA